jgi:uncharacterized small protein (DUF1192 family)
MDLEDLEPRKQQPKPKDLESLGVEELEEYLAELESEAERVREKIAAKKAYLSGAAGLFKDYPLPSRPGPCGRAARWTRDQMNKAQPTGPSKITKTSQPTRGPSGHRAPGGGRHAPALGERATCNIGSK